MFLLDGKPINIDSEQVINGIRYPHLRSADLRGELGVVEQPDEQSYDQRFYWGVGNPKDLDGLKTQWIAQVKDTAGKMLSPTDWKVVRAAEGVKPVDADTLSFRASVRAYSDSLEASISACTSVEDLISVVSNQAWPDSKRT